MNFKEDLKKILIDELAQFDENIDDSCNIKELVRKHFNLLAKTIRPYPRKIHKSTEFVNKEKTLDDQFKTALYEICKKLEVGENVNAHLSKDAIKPSYNDLLQNDWGIHHLHISKKLDEKDNRFYKRSDWLFFALIKPSNAYLIDMHLHKTPYGFAKKDLLKVVYRNWPEIMEPFELKGVAGGSKGLSDKEISVTRKKHCNVIQEIDDKVFAPMGGAISAAGTNINHTEDATYLLLKLKMYEQRLTEENTAIKDQLKKQGIDIKGVIDFELFIDDIGDISVREKTSKVRINFN